MSRSHSLIRVTTSATVITVFVTLLAGCGAAMPVPTPTPTATVLPSGDGILRIGTIFPSTGQLASFGPAQVAGVEAAIREINEAQGVGGVPVEVFHRDSADSSTQKAEESLAALIGKGVDVVIGPSASDLAERLAPLVGDAKVTMISPAATHPQLTDIDDAGFFFRTIPAYGQQGTLLGEYLSAAGPVDVAVVYLDDELGRSLEGALATSLEGQGSVLIASQAVKPTATDFAKLIAAVKKARPDVVVLATPDSAREQTSAIITQLSAAGLGGTKLWLTSLNTVDYSEALPAGLLVGVSGIIDGAVPDDAFIARLTQSDPALSSFRYAAESYDATILAALAAFVIGDDSGQSVAAALQGVSRGGIKCTSFGECLDVLKTETDIDYDGLSGPLDFTDAGDVRPAFYTIYQYNAENRYEFASGIVG